MKGEMFQLTLMLSLLRCGFPPSDIISPSYGGFQPSYEALAPLEYSPPSYGWFSQSNEEYSPSDYSPPSYEGFQPSGYSPPSYKHGILHQNYDYFHTNINDTVYYNW